MAVYRIGVRLAAALLPFGDQVHASLQDLRVSELRNDLGHSFIVGILLGPIAEEVFYRGVLFRGLRKRWSAEISSMVTALLFTMIHSRFYYFIPTFVVGFVACQLYERRQSLIAPITLHGIWNLVATGASLLRQ